MMPWTTASGRTVDFPYPFFAELIRSPNPSPEAVKKAVDQAHKTHMCAIELNNQVIRLQEEVKRLKHENEFMLRLINDRDNQCS
jgi:hypothetical protein